MTSLLRMSVGTPLSAPVWSRDSERLAFLWNDRGMPVRDVWVADPANGSRWRATDFAARDEAPSTGTEPAGPRRSVGAVEVAWTDSGDALVINTGDAVYEVRTDGTALREVLPAGATKASLQVSPDGLFLSLLQDGDLWLLERATGALRQVTRFGVPPVGEVPGARNSRPDVEFSSYLWSPDARFVALHLDDRRSVRKVMIPTHGQSGAGMQYLRRDFPGENDHIRAIAIYATRPQNVAMVPLPENTDRRITGFRWSPDGSKLLVDQRSESAEHRWLYAVSPDDASYVELYHEHRPRRTTTYWTSDWRTDGEAILLTAELTGRHHLYALGVTDGSLRRLTAGDWDLLGPVRSPSPLVVLPTTGDVFFVSTEKSPSERHVCRIAEFGGPVVPITSEPGIHLPFPSPDGRRLAILFSNDVTPPELYVTDVANAGAPGRRIAQPGRGDTGVPWVAAEYVTFPSHADGATLHGRLLKPPDVDQARPAPVILGPVYHDTVRNEWRGAHSLIQQHLVARGYIILQVDVRGSTGYGREFIEALALDYGGIDVEDLESAVEFLRTLDYADPSRIGIWGQSYGGLLVLMSLFKKPGVYRAGVAGAPASNLWHARPDEISNAGRPADHPDEYARSSAITYGEALADHLMIIHGMQDDVVLFEDSAALAEKLMMLGKRFELVVAPSAAHAMWDKDYHAQYLANELVDHFDRHLGTGGATGAASGAGTRSSGG